ncbi:MAG: HAD family hydrolase [Treponema sp.]|jgi:phosphoglycolate phosphatase/putative hydrolase of the HAD superfamily|nr:HAD family hydrolase [Treponema sp.]
MTIYKLPEPITAFLFDMDSTLYTNREYFQFQIDSPIRRLARLRGVSFDRMQQEIAAYRRDWAAAHGGQQTSLGNVFMAFGISIEESIRWREELYEPAAYLKADPRLQETLTTLGASCALGLVTNNPVFVARKTLACLGVDALFQVIVGLDTCGVSKPHAAPFLKALELLDVSPAASVSVGDRYDIDLARPLELGMGGILVDGVADVYMLVEALNLR